MVPSINDLNNYIQFFEFRVWLVPDFRSSGFRDSGFGVLYCSVSMFYQLYHNATKNCLNYTQSCLNTALKWLHKLAFNPLLAIKALILVITFSGSNVNTRYSVCNQLKCLLSYLSHTLSYGSLLTQYHRFCWPFLQL